MKVLICIGILVVMSSCGASTLFYNPNDMCQQEKRRKGKFKQQDMDTRGKSSKKK